MVKYKVVDMKQPGLKKQCEDYIRIEKAIRFIEKNHIFQPSLDEIAGSVNLSRYHFDRLFKRWAGISPIRFLHFLTLDYAKRKLRASGSVLDASLASGLSGPSRLHDLFVSHDAMTPGEFKKMGRDLKIIYGWGGTPFGKCLLAQTERGICHLGFTEEGKDLEFVKDLKALWPESNMVEDGNRVAPVIEKIFRLERVFDKHPFHLMLKGTNFQVRVWQALLTIPEGNIRSYQDIAAYLGKPKAMRAVASAIAKNPVSYLIPCHRVIRKTGQIHNYRWGSARKKAMLGWEASRNYLLQNSAHA